MHRHSQHANNERNIEVTLGHRWLSEYRDTTVEVGAVMPNNGEAGHRVVDWIDPHATERVDAETVDFTGASVLCLSTLEHFGMAEVGDPLDPAKAVRFLRQLSKTVERALITVPMGYHLGLDEFLRDTPALIRAVYRRTGPSEWECWAQDWPDSIWDGEFNAPFTAANVLLVLGWLEGITL